MWEESSPIIVQKTFHSAPPVHAYGGAVGRINHFLLRSVSQICRIGKSDDELHSGNLWAAVGQPSSGSIIIMRGTALRLLRLFPLLSY